MACPILKTLQINFTAPNPVPDNGYRVKWRVVGTTTYINVLGPFVNSPILLNNIPSCENIEGTVEAVCGGTFSSVATFLATKDTVYICNASISDTTTSGTYYIYPKRLFDLQGSSDTVTINYDATGNPNRFNFYNSNNQIVATSDWKGVSTYPGPWGTSLNTTSNGLFSFSKAASGGDKRWYYLTTEFVGIGANTSDNWNVTVGCTITQTPWTVTPSSTSVYEGSTITFNVTTVNIPNGSVLYYTVSGLQQADFTDSTTSGSFTVTNNTGSFTKTINNDGVAEGTESFTVSVRMNSNIGEIKATTPVITVLDGLAPAIEAYSITPSVTTVSEGNSVTFNISAANTANGTVLYYTVGGSGITASDFVDNTLSGSLTINNGLGAFTKTLTNDVLTEGVEIFDVQLRVNSIGGNTVAYYGPINITDTSLTGGAAGPTYTLRSFNDAMQFVTSINEGTTLTIRLDTTDVVNGTSIPYAVTGILQSDLTGASDTLTGNMTVNSGYATKVFYINSDTTTEGVETFTFSLTGLSKSINVTINDSSPTSSWTTYNLYEVSQYDCVMLNGTSAFTAYKLNSAGVILTGNILYTSANVNNPVPFGFYSDGTYRYRLDGSTGLVDLKEYCPSSTGTPAYYLTARENSLWIYDTSEGQTIEFTLSTDNVANGTIIPWIVSGISAADLSAGTLSGNFTVGSVDMVSFTIANDLLTEGVESMTMTLPNHNTNYTVTIADSSQSAVTYYQLSGCLQANYGYTTVPPTLGSGQQYVLPGTSTTFYTYTGVSQSYNYPPVSYNGSFQRTTLLGCP